MGSACSQCLRIVLVVFNFLVVLIGLTVLGFAVYAFLEPEAQDLIEASGHKTGVRILLFALMGTGALILIIALFGCCGAYHESPGLLATYFSFLIIIFVAQIVGATVAFIYRKELMQHADEKLTEGVDQYKIQPSAYEQSIRFMDSVQRLLECCGADGPQDYKSNPPIACCNSTYYACQGQPIMPVEVYPMGCKDKYKKKIMNDLYIIFVVTVAIALFEILGLLFSMIMCCSIRKYNAGYDGVEYTIDS